MKKAVISRLAGAAGAGSAFLAVFLAGKLLTGHSGLSWWQWLTDTSPLLHSYLFGWLIMHKRFWLCALLAILPNLFDWQRFSAAVCTGFTAGLCLGELFHPLLVNPGQSGIPASWCIWFSCFVLSIAGGIYLERRKKKA